MDSVVHFELPYDDRERMARFYESAFSWRTQMMGEEMGNYVLATTTELDEAGMPTSPGAINGGLTARGPGATQPSLVIAVDDIRASMAKVTSAGGTVHGEPMEIAGVGHLVLFTDTEGNHLSMMQPLPRG